MNTQELIAVGDAALRRKRPKADILHPENLLRAALNELGLLAHQKEVLRVAYVHLAAYAGLRSHPHVCEIVAIAEEPDWLHEPEGYFNAAEGASYPDRVTDLLNSNAALLERARTAEARVRELEAQAATGGSIDG